MAEYIEREALERIFKNWLSDEELLADERIAVETCLAQLEDAPAADVVEVVRCKDCIHHTDDIMNDAVVWCERYGIAHLRDYYCSDGKGEGE